MGEESDGDAAGDLLADDEQSNPGERSESTDGGAAADATEDDGRDASDAATERSDESTNDDSPDETDAAENGGQLTADDTEGDGSAEAPATDESLDSDGSAEADATESVETDEPAESNETDEPAETDETDQAETDASDSDASGNLQPYEPPDVSLDPDEMEVEDVPATEAETEELEEEAPLAEDVVRDDDLDYAERNQPLEDEEMPLADHIEEMMKRLAVVIVVAGVVSLAVLPFAEPVINFLWNSVLPTGQLTRPRVYAPLGLIMTRLKVASLGGVIIALPVLVYETYLFMRPGLYPHERRYYLAAVPTSLVLAFVGVSFAYFLVLPIIFSYFLYYSESVTTIAFALTKTFNLILLMMGYLAIVFQIPLFIMLAVMMGLVTRQWMADRRLYFWGGFLGISFLFSFDPTGMAPFMVASTMVALFEGTLILLKWTGK